MMELDEVIKQPLLFKFGSGSNEYIQRMSNDMSSFDSGFDSLLNLSLNDDSSCCGEYSPAKSARLTFEQKSPMMTITPPKQHSSPASPIKQQHVFLPPTPSKASSGGGMVITPIKRVNQVADVNGIYLSCIKSPLKSPTNYYNTDTYIRERDSHTANLLRSPAFKIQYGGLETTPVKKIKCRQFSAATTEVESEKPKATPTEEEFLQLLFKNRHIAANSECIIGRCMGLEHFDIITELNKRSMNNVLDIILNNLNASDYKNIYHVNKTWREVIQQDKKRNKERVKYIRFKRKFIESAKENISSPGFIQETLKIKRKFSLISSTSAAFNKLDINCLNNTSINDASSNFNSSILSACSTKSDNSSVCYFDFDNNNTTTPSPLFEKSTNVDEKMVMTDLMNQRNRKLSIISPPAPVLLSKQLSLDDECLNGNKKSTTAKVNLANSTKICSKTSKRNLKRL